jgi:carbamoyltransferase
MKIAGVFSGHDCSYTIMNNGIPVIHDELERFIRQKEPYGDSVQFMFEKYKNVNDIDIVATCQPIQNIKDYKKSYNRLEKIIKKNNGKFYCVGHHKAHAANAFFSSNFKNALIVTLDGGGVEDDNVLTACTAWTGLENKIANIFSKSINKFNIGGLWTRVTRYVFKLQSGWPRGHQAGSIMAMAAFGNPDKYKSDFLKMFTKDLKFAAKKPPGQPQFGYLPSINGEYRTPKNDVPGCGCNSCVGKMWRDPACDPTHPYLEKWSKIVKKSEQDKFDVAAGLQSATEEVFKNLLSEVFSIKKTKNLCLSGGVVLNCVMIGKIKKWFPFLENIYIPPVTHDGGLSIGAAQYVWHQELKNPRIMWKDNFTPYLGKKYTENDIINTLNKKSNKVSYKKINDSNFISLLEAQKIIAIFGKGSESGRRALGNRSIICDPRSEKMRGLINKKVKHRQWFRPFAPSILRSKVKDWFVYDVDSPYMTHAIPFKKNVTNIIPAVVHHDGTARLQTVTEDDNKWYHAFLKKWYEKTGVPIILNTSFNDREPICETPEHALRCFLGTKIDHIYFYEYNILVTKKD